MPVAILCPEVMAFNASTLAGRSNVMIRHDPSDDVPESTEISDARLLATQAVMLLEHPKMKVEEGSGLYGTALSQARLILHAVLETERCTDAEEFDVLLYLICCQADGLAETLTLLRIP
jgi:hypothetical protein